MSLRAAIYANSPPREIASRRVYRAAGRQFETWWTSLGREPLAANADAITMVVRRADDFTDKFGTH